MLFAYSTWLLMFLSIIQTVMSFTNSTFCPFLPWRMSLEVHEGQRRWKGVIKSRRVKQTPTPSDVCLTSNFSFILHRKYNRERWNDDGSNNKLKTLFPHHHQRFFFFDSLTEQIHRPRNAFFVEVKRFWKHVKIWLCRKKQNPEKKTSIKMKAKKN